MFTEPIAYPFTLEGGLDQSSSALTKYPGRLLACDGIEIMANEPGYHRRGGYERCTNDLMPSGVTVIHVEVTVTGTIAKETAFTCGSAVAWPLVDLAEDGHVPCATFEDIMGNDVFSDGTNSFTVTERIPGNRYYTADEVYAFRRQAIEMVRDLVPEVPGDGPLRGGFRLRGVNYAFRNDNTALKLYQAGRFSWTEVPMPTILRFKAGIVEPKPGWVVTDGDGTATIDTVSRQAGAWNYEEEDYSEGYLTVSGVTGTFAPDRELTRVLSAIAAISNGTFATADDWTEGDGWIIDSGVATCDGTQTEASQLSIASTIPVERKIRLTYTITRSAGELSIKLGTVAGQKRSAAGTYTELIESAEDNPDLIFEADAAFAGTVDNVSWAAAETVPAVVNGDFASDTVWDKGEGWSIAAGVASCDGSQIVASYLEQDYYLPKDRAVEITFTVSGMSAGVLRAMVGEEYGPEVRENGTYTHLIVPFEDTLTLGFEADAAFVGSIDAVSIAAVGFATTDSASFAYELQAITGKCRSVRHNFSNESGKDSIFGVTGGNEAFEFDGEHYIPIYHPESDEHAGEYPYDVLIHQERLMLAYPGGQWIHSVSRQPRTFNQLLGGGSHICGSEITAAKVVQGNTAVVFCSDSFWLLTGDGVYDDKTSTRNWSFYKYDENIGAEPFSVAGRGEHLFFSRGEIRSLKTTAAYGGFFTTPMSGDIADFLARRSGLVADSVWHQTKGQYRLFFADGQAAYLTMVGTKIKGATTLTLPHVPTVVWSTDEDGVQRIYFGADDGYLRRMDSGNTCDEQSIRGSMRLPYYAYGNVRQTKQFLQLILEFLSPVRIGNDTTFTWVANYSYGNPDAPRPRPETVESLPVAGGIYGANTGYGSMAYGGASVAELVAYLEGYGSTLSFLVVFETKYDSPFVLLSVITDYIPLGMEQR
jgi:hypothetical protein